VSAARRAWPRALAALALAALGSTAGCAPEPGPHGEPLTVFAAASLAEAFGEAGRRFEADHRGVTVRFNFAGSQQLATQIEQGAAADVFASADRRWMDEVRDHGLLVGAPAEFARNRLVVVAPRQDPAAVTTLEGLARPGVRVVLGSEAVPAGAYARTVLRHLSRQPGFGAGYARAVLENVASEEENVKSVLAKVVLGEADAGFVYRSDVTPEVAARVRVIGIPEAANAPADYPIAVLRGSRRPEAARAFVGLVRSAEGRRILERHGFAPPERGS
jgi:molybdate transport system substrate-binding protein